MNLTLGLKARFLARCSRGLKVLLFVVVGHLLFWKLSVKIEVVRSRDKMLCTAIIILGRIEKFEFSKIKASYF